MSLMHSLIFVSSTYDGKKKLGKCACLRNSRPQPGEAQVKVRISKVVSVLGAQWEQ